MEQTLSIIKPDAVAKGVIGKILDRFESNGLKIAAMKKVQLSRQDAEAFYAVHAARPFFNDLVDFMVSGPVVITVLEGENAILKNRDLMGATNPKEAAAGTIRADFAENIDANAVHGSDSAENAAIEIAFFFFRARNFVIAMKIAFRKLSSQPLHFEENSDNAHFSGDLTLKKSNLAQLNGTITGSIVIPCDMCAEEVEKPLDETITFYVSDGIYEGSDAELDVVEIDQSMIDLEELLKSEIELIKSDYFCCQNCEGTSLDREF